MPLTLAFRRIKPHDTHLIRRFFGRFCAAFHVNNAYRRVLFRHETMHGRKRVARLNESATSWCPPACCRQEIENIAREQEVLAEASSSILAIKACNFCQEMETPSVYYILYNGSLLYRYSCILEVTRERQTTIPPGVFSCMVHCISALSPN